jgi:predicted transposase YbfD/YdcC
LLSSSVLEEGTAVEGFCSAFEGVADPRSGNRLRHDLLEVLFIALGASLCGAESCVDMADFAEAKEDVLREFLTLPGGPPSHDTFSRIFRLLDPEAFHAAFQRFMADFSTAQATVVALDGKTVRRSFDRATAASPLHLVSAWAADERLVLGQMKVATDSNEITAVPALLKLLSIEGAVVTVDAMHCQSGTAQAILDRGADYLMTVKANQPRLHEDVALLMDDPAAPADDVDETVDGDHGRIETRRAEVIHDVAWLAEAHGWPRIAAVGRIVATREIDGKQARSVRYFLASKPFSAAELNRLARGHWGIENALHWVLDVVMNEDQARARKDHAPENLALLRRFALNIIKQNRDKGSNRLKFKRAGWDNRFLRKLFAEITP